MSRNQLVVMGTLVVIFLGVAFEGGLSAEAFFGANPTSNTPPPFQIEEGTFNLQIQAVEVTQGVRGEIPSRVSPASDLVFSPDGTAHIASRRTIVRAYPWVLNGSEAKVPPVTARLWAYRDGVLLFGSPISPQNYNLKNISPDWDLETMRADAEKSWNFPLPSAWTASDLDNGSFTLRFVVEVNPTRPDHQPECQECGLDNQVSLGGQEFVAVPALVIQPYFVEHTVMERDGSLVTYPGPTVAELKAEMKIVHSMLPVGDLDRGLTLLPPISVEWQGLLYEDGVHVFAEAMIDQHLPGGVLEAGGDSVIHLFVFSADRRYNFLVNYNSDGMRLGLAWNGKPYAQTGARGLEMVHELTHAIGLSHAGNGYGEATTNTDYPDPSGRVESNAYGFDVWEMRAVPPVSEQGATHDFMSYNSLDPAWVSVYTWEAIGNLLGQPNLDV